MLSDSAERGDTADPAYGSFDSIVVVRTETPEAATRGGIAHLDLSRSVVIDGVPQMDRTKSDAAKRFILLIDNLYDRGVKLGASFAVPLEQLGKDDRTAFEFQRTISRLDEMQSEDYLAKGLRDAVIDAAGPAAGTL